MNFLQGRRTQIIATAISVLGLVQQFGSDIIPANFQGWSLFIVGLAMIALRQITTTAPGKKP